jgi:hypothetical protein
MGREKGRHRRGVGETGCDKERREGWLNDGKGKGGDEGRREGATNLE